MNKLDFFDYWTLAEVLYCLALLFILPREIKINFWIILTSKETYGSVFNIFGLPLMMCLPNLLRRSFENNLPYSPKLRGLTLFANIILLLLTSFWLLNLLFR